MKVFPLLLSLLFICPMTANALPFKLRYGMQPSEINYKINKPQHYYYTNPCHLQPFSSINLSPLGSDIVILLFNLRATTFKDLKHLTEVKDQEHFIKFLRGEEKVLHKDWAKVNPKVKYLINVLEKLFKTDEFKAFLEFQLPDDDKVIIYDIDGNSVCTQFLDNELVQVSLTNYGFEDKLLEIFYALKEKYQIQTTTYRLDSGARFVVKGSADAQDIGNVEIYYPNYTFKKGFFQSVPLLGGGNNNSYEPHITYSEPLMIKRYKEKIQKSQIYYEKNILAPMLDRIDKLSSEEINKKDPYLDQF